MLERRFDAGQCRGHSFFKGIDFAHLHEAQPPIVPAVSSPDDTKHFDSFKFQPLPATQPGAKDTSMEWVHYDFDRTKKDLHQADVNVDTIFLAKRPAGSDELFSE